MMSLRSTLAGSALRLIVPFAVVTGLQPMGVAMAQTAETSAYDTLVSLFAEWREFERPPMTGGVPDYGAATMDRRQAALESLRRRVEALDWSEWPVSQQVDYHLVLAEMNGFDFNYRVLKPWVRDPAFYQQVWTYESDTPAHEGPTNHALIELWTYDFPLSDSAAADLASQLRTVRPFLAQARRNLTGNARDLWTSGTQTMRLQAEHLKDLRAAIGGNRPELEAAIADAMEATNGFIAWLEGQAASKTGPSGIGKDNYTWYLQNVHLVPLTWDDEVMLLKRELARAHASLRLEEHRNIGLPEIPVVQSPEEYEERAKEAVDRYMAFMAENDILPVKDYMKPALMERIGSFSPEDDRNFFAQATHREPMTLWTHFYHWWDLARMEQEPHGSPLRQDPLLYNIFDSRAEGMATAMEEMMMHAGLFDDNPRAREIVWIMQAQRAARGLASLRAHANEYTMADASEFHVRWTPRGWMSPDLDLLGFEQQLYLRQPGYGTSYITGKHLIEKLYADRAQQVIEEQGGTYALSDFFSEVNDAGVIPVSLVRWELTGDGSEVRDMLAKN
jgi:hypothetical protein